ncbi:MAG: DHH family phosphoesterase [Candidatus Micrarchaeia archaeon]
MKRLARELSSLKGKTLVLTHALADLDACASAIVLARALHAQARCPDKPTASAKHALEALGFSIAALGAKEKFDNLILVDVSNVDLLGDAPVKGYKRVIVIDHHFHSKPLKADYSHIERERPSCAEIIHSVCLELGRAPDARESALLLAGIIHDTAFFKSADSRTLQTAARLSVKADYRSVLAACRVRRDKSEVNGVFAALGKARLLEANGLIVGVTATNAFELACAAALVDAGCDYGVALNAKQGRMSCVKAVGAKGNAGKTMEAAGKAFGGSGGGHEHAAGARGTPEKSSKALKTALKHLLLLSNNNL